MSLVNPLRSLVQVSTVALCLMLGWATATAQDAAKPTEGASPAAEKPADTAPATADSDKPDAEEAPTDSAAESPEPSDAPAVETPTPESHRLFFQLPKGLTAALIHDDARAAIYTIEGVVAPIDIYVIKANAEGIADPAKYGAKVTGEFLNMQKHLDFQSKGRTRVEMFGCSAVSWKYKDGDLQSRVATCYPEGGPYRYIFHLEIEEALKEDAEEVVKGFHVLMSKYVALLGDDGKPLPRKEPVVLKKPATTDKAVPKGGTDSKTVKPPTK